MNQDLGLEIRSEPILAAETIGRSDDDLQHVFSTCQLIRYRSGQLIVVFRDSCQAALVNRRRECFLAVPLLTLKGEPGPQSYREA